MPSPGTISGWLHDLACAGDERAVHQLWQAYYEKLVTLARRRLRAMPRKAAADEEDVALSAFASFIRAVDAGRFPRLDDRDDLWQVLIVLTIRKASDLLQSEGRAKRNLWVTQCLGDLFAAAADDAAGSVFSGLLVSGEPPPELAVEVAEECERLLALLGEDELRQIAVFKMEGYTNPEIAEELGCALATVERRLRLIRKRWEGEVSASEEAPEESAPT